MSTSQCRALCCAVLLLVAAPLAGQAPCDDNPWTSGWAPSWKSLFQGIDWMSACTTRLPSQPGTPGVRTQRANALRIDLQAPGIQFFSAPKVASAGSYDTNGQRASDFLCTWGLQVAINANFFWPCCTEEPKSPPKTPPPPIPVKLCGLAADAGQVVSELTSVPQASDAGVEALLIRAGNQASFATVTQGTKLPAGLCTAVAGSPQPAQSGYCPQSRVQGPLMLLAGGSNQSPASSDPNPPEMVAARTAVALGKDGRFLFLLTLDGTDNSTSGAGFYDEAAWLLALGGWNGINLDGGGSTTMAARLQAGQVTVLNNPSESCQQRYVGTFLGVKANPAAKPYTPAGCGTRPCSGSPQTPPACTAARAPSR